MCDTGSAVFSVSVNGSFAAPTGLAFGAIDAAYLSPAFTGHGQYRLNLGDRPFAFAPPDEGYGSVSLYMRRRLETHAATAFANVRVVCTAQQGDGMEVKGRLLRRNGETMYEMVISNHTQQPLSGFAVQFIENMFSLVAGTMLDITGAFPSLLCNNCACILLSPPHPLLSVQPGESVPTSFAVKFGGASMAVIPHAAVHYGYT